ncbi:hypothetical protein DSO57_1017041 [Entomophthora muscae]|uniref:Uncharacterized protein n=1 Tax=Entomophthora muscae TaxID=34485 RepID=A0ACC2SHR1_9FUNG|nr:hypothetical protein DSO57_1017041 [Entomophthora muscae]
MPHQSKNYRIALFISKLYWLLESKTNTNSIAWDSSCNGFTIYDPIKFEEILILHFHSSSIQSFYRQLQLYGFKRTSDQRKTRHTSGLKTTGFRHPNFRPNFPEGLLFIRRESLKQPCKFKYFKPKQEKSEQASNLDLSSIEELPNTLIVVTPNESWFVKEN